MNTKHSRQGMIPALEALKSLENEIAEVKYAAGLAAGLVNHFPSYVKLPDGYVSVTMKRDELEQLDFAVYEVQRRAIALNEGYQAIELSDEAAPARPKPMPVSDGDIVDAKDRLNEGIMLLHTTWLAMAGQTVEQGMVDDFEALTDTIWQSLAKLQDAKKGFGG